MDVPRALPLVRAEPLACGLGLNGDELTLDAADVVQRTLAVSRYDRTPNIDGIILHCKGKKRIYFAFNFALKQLHKLLKRVTQT